jgi:cellobiose-specific phosphotransferase system component IIB
MTIYNRKSTFIVSIIGVFLLFILTLHSCYVPARIPENNTTSTNKEYSSTLQNTPNYNEERSNIRKYSEKDWDNLFNESQSVLQNVSLLHKFLNKQNLEKKFQEINSLLYGEMKDVTFYRKITIDSNSYDKESLAFFKFSTKREDNFIERNLIDLTILGYTAKKIKDLYNQHNINIFKISPRGIGTIENEDVMIKEVFASQIVIAEIEDVQPDLTLKDGYRSTMTLNILESLKGSVQEKKIKVRCFNGPSSDGGYIEYSHIPEDFRNG